MPFMPLKPGKYLFDCTVVTIPQEGGTWERPKARGNPRNVHGRAAFVAYLRAKGQRDARQIKQTAKGLDDAITECGVIAMNFPQVRARAEAHKKGQE